METQVLQTPTSSRSQNACCYYFNAAQRAQKNLVKKLALPKGQNRQRRYRTCEQKTGLAEALAAKSSRKDQSVLSKTQSRSCKTSARMEEEKSRDILRETASENAPAAPRHTNCLRQSMCLLRRNTRAIFVSGSLRRYGYTHHQHSQPQILYTGTYRIRSSKANGLAQNCAHHVYELQLGQTIRPQ